MKRTLLALCISLPLGLMSVIGADPRARTELTNFINQHVIDQFAAVFFVPGVTATELQNKYLMAGQVNLVPQPSTTHKIKVLIMPGHEPNFGGTEYEQSSGVMLKERELNVELANSLAKLLRTNPHYEVVVPRDNNHWDQIFTTYFRDHNEDIKAFAKRQRYEMAQLFKNGEIKKLDSGVTHNKAPDDVAYRIFGINKWANENGVDIAIHIHFNDYPRRRSDQPGKYNGFAIYVPEHQYSNSSTTQAIAQTIERRLSSIYATSNMPKESQGIVEEQDLIAIGSHNSVDAPSMLIEYGYIYQPELQMTSYDKRAVARTRTLEDMAFQTYLGLQDFFGSGNDVTLGYNSLDLPHTWNTNISKTSMTTQETVSDVFSLQTALMIEGVYPPEGESKNDCPRTGKFGPCTSAAVAQFQKKYTILGENGFLGERTREKLNSLYSPKTI